MYKWYKWLVVIIALCGGLLFLQLVSERTATPAIAQRPNALKPIVSYPLKSDRSPALRTLVSRQPVTPTQFTQLPRLFKPAGASSGTARATGRDPLLHSLSVRTSMPVTLTSFDGVSNSDNVSLYIGKPMPPDSEGDIGYDPSTSKKYYVEWVNLSYRIWDVTTTPTLLAGPIAGNAFWTGFGGPCATTNDGDPIVLFDPIAKRWLVSQFSFPNYLSGSSANGPFYQCLAISASADPTGSYYRYVYVNMTQSGLSKLNDYPKFGVWPDGYYMSMNQFDEGTLKWYGAGAVVFERDKMLAGDPFPRMLYFDLNPVNPLYGGMLPSDLDGTTLPPTGSPNYFAEVDAAGGLGSTDALRIWNFQVDWANAANSTFGLSGTPNQTLPVAAFSYLPCVSALSMSCIPQPNTGTKLDSVGDRLMYRLQYRNFGTHETLVTNHTVDAGDFSGHAGIRWYELHKTGGGSWGIYQQGTYAPDSDNRWMGSIALDQQGNAALGFSVSSSTTYPSIRYVGRLVTDTLGTLPQGEATLIQGSGSQTGSGTASNRWGDYSMMAVDPADDCTFWYVDEYYPASSQYDWHTRIGSFKFPSCGAGPLPTFTFTPTATSTPIATPTPNINFLPFISKH